MRRFFKYCLLLVSFFYCINMQGKNGVDIYLPDSIAAFDTNSIEKSIIPVDSILHLTYDLQPFRTSDNNSWVFYCLLIPLLIFINIRLFFFKDFLELFRAFLNYNISMQLFRMQESALSGFSILINVNFFLVAGMFLYQLTLFFSHGIEISGLLLYVILIIVVMLIYLVKYSTLRILAWIFPFNEELDFYNFHVFMSNRVIGILFIPVNIILAYGPDSLTNALMWVFITWYLLMVSFRYYRGIIIAKDYLVLQKFYFFLYLSTLEIIPVITMLKWLNNKGII